MGKRVLAFDFGASSGRAVIGEIQNGKLEYKEIHRFSNDSVMVNGTLFWDYLRLFHEIKVGITKAKLDGGFASIGIDTWGVDFAMLDKAGRVIDNPVHYRDNRTVGIKEEIFKSFDKIEFYKQTGLQFMDFNTVFQLYSLYNKTPDIANRVDKILMTADFFAYLLTGEKRSEFTLASTTGLLDPNTNEWNKDLAKKLNINPDVFCDLIPSKGVYGNLRKDICNELDVESVPVVAVCCHDTASAVLSVPSVENEILYISSGTWSLFGTEIDEPFLTKEAFDLELTNERGFDKSVRLLKNIMGLWIIQEVKRQWEKEGINLTFNEIALQAQDATSFRSYIDVDDIRFATPFNMVEKIRSYCKETKQYVPITIGEIARTVYESLAVKYKKTLDEIVKLTGREFKELNIVGGGSNVSLLNQFTANCLGIKVIAGPSEGTVLGNIALQLMAGGEIANLQEVRKLVKASNNLKEFNPTSKVEFKNYFDKFAKLKI